MINTHEVNPLIKRTIFCVAIGCLSIISLNAAAISLQAGKAITIKGAWMQLGPASQKNTAAFMVVENHSSKEIALLSASSDVCEVVELHKMETVNEMMRMKKVDNVVIPANGQTEFKPGGYHLMVIGLKRPLKDGEEVEVKLQFADSIQKTIKVPVKNRESMQ